MAKNITDMTTGAPLRHIIRFAIPLFIGNLFQQLYNVVDSIVVGNFVGANALAAVGACGSLGFLFFSLSGGLAIGIGIMASQFFGARDERQIRTTVANSVFILVSAGAAVSLVGFTLAPVLLRMLNTPAEILPDAARYLRITSLGIIAVALYNGVAALLRALGDSRSPLYFLIISCLVNVVLDVTFVYFLGLGVMGVALATIIAQGFSFVVSVIYAWVKVPYFRLTRAELKPHGKLILRCLKLGVPVAMQSAMIAISVMTLQGIVNSFGASVMAAYTVVCRVEELVQQPFISLSTAATNFSGQNMGAGKIDRVERSFRICTLVLLCFCLVMIPVFFLFGDSVISLFVKDAQVVAIGFVALCIDSLFFFPLSMIHLPRGVLNGCGDSGFAIINGFTEVVCRIVFANILTRISFIGYWGIWITTGLTWLITCLVCIHRYRRGKWREMAIV